MQHNIQSILVRGQAELRIALELDAITARIEVQTLLQLSLHVSRAFLLAHPEHILSHAEDISYQALFQRRLCGEPIAYLVGEREFYGLMFKVTPATLIPRPETELLVELALQYIHAEKQISSSLGGGVFRVLDLGTGSGAIALAIAHSYPKIEVVAVDASAEALKIARENALRLAIGNTVFVQSDWFGALTAQQFNLIASNPPYVAAADPHLQQGDLRFEPSSALASGVEGLEDIRHIIAQARTYLQPGGWLMLEHGYDQAHQVRELMWQAGLGAIYSACDLAGIERVSCGRNEYLS